MKDIINRRFISEEFDDVPRTTTMQIPNEYLEFMKSAAKSLGYTGFAHMMTDITAMIIRPPENLDDSFEQILAIRKMMPNLEKVILDTVDFYLKESGIEQHELQAQAPRINSNKNSIFRQDNPNIGKTVAVKLKGSKTSDNVPKTLVSEKKPLAEIAEEVLRKCFYINLDLKGEILLEVFLNTKKHRPLHTTLIGEPSESLVGKPLSEEDVNIADEKIPLNSVVLNLVIGNNERIFFHKYSPTIFYATKIFCKEQAHALRPMIYAREGRQQSPNWEPYENLVESILSQFMNIRTDAPELKSTEIFEEVSPLVDKINSGKAKDTDRLKLYETIEAYIEERFIAGLSMSQALQNFSQVEFADNPNFPAEINAFLQGEAVSSGFQNVYNNLTMHDAWYVEDETEEDEEYATE